MKLVNCLSCTYTTSLTPTLTPTLSLPLACNSVACICCKYFDGSLGNGFFAKTLQMSRFPIGFQFTAPRGVSQSSQHIEAGLKAVPAAAASGSNRLVSRRVCLTALSVCVCVCAGVCGLNVCGKEITKFCHGFDSSQQHKDM